MLRLPHWMPFGRPDSGAYHCILRFPDSIEDRWVDRLPAPGTRLVSHTDHWLPRRTWIVDEVLQSGRETFTVFLVSRAEYRERRRDREPDLADDLVELARDVSTTASERRRRWKERR